MVKHQRHLIKLINAPPSKNRDEAIKQHLEEDTRVFAMKQ